MHFVFRPVVALTLVGATFCFALPASHIALAQASKLEASAAKQLALSEKQVVALLAAQKDLDGFVATPGTNAAVLAQIDGVAKKHGFANYAEYTILFDNIGLAMAGIDPKTKTYVGPVAVIKQKIATVQADKSLSAEDRKEAIDDLNAKMASPPPAVENKGNIDLAIKYYDKLAVALKDD
ncbi:hypothetical protein J2W51_001316 [Tardiphaga robiniae]|uniref:hypothetical protein n=1 Tax=Tardiphaga robiniae TaxID=943830 RepID=UPI002855F2DE|nr:hypothetical protein [Tardiphaga robiniae]MDR6658774.1 hypothetical protein [Tardiphaga robiniae]